MERSNTSTHCQQNTAGGRYAKSSRQVCEMAPNNNSEVRVLAAERGELLHVMMQHSREMKRHETCSRFATGFLLLALFGTFLLIQLSVHRNEDPPVEQPMPSMAGQAQAQVRNKTLSGRHRVHSMHFLSQDPEPTTRKNNSNVIRWAGQEFSKAQLRDNNTSLYISKKGWYLINLRISFRIPDGPCPCNHSEETEDDEDILCFLKVSVMLYHSNYAKWLDVAVAKETMPCTSGSSRAVTLNRVIKLEKSTVLIVTVKNEKLISPDINNYFDVTHL